VWHGCFWIAAILCSLAEGEFGWAIPGFPATVLFFAVFSPILILVKPGAQSTGVRPWAVRLVRASRILLVPVFLFSFLAVVTHVFLTVQSRRAYSQTEITPLDQPLREEREITITCELTQPPEFQEVPVFDSARDSEAANGTYHYNLWLPKGYLSDSQRRWPCLFIASAEGEAGMGQMTRWMKSHGYIVVMLVESRNGPWAPIVGNFLAAHDDAVRRVRIQDGRKVATGVSGAARASSVFVQLRPGFSGLILQAAGFAYGENGQYHLAGLKRIHPLFVAMTMGDSDDNREEVGYMRDAFGGTNLLVLNFKGGHMAAPRETIERALDWYEQQIHQAQPDPR
jgi:hypothetical protein